MKKKKSQGELIDIIVSLIMEKAMPPINRMIRIPSTLKIMATFGGYVSFTIISDPIPI